MKLNPDTQSNEDNPIRIVAAAVKKYGVVFTGVRHSQIIQQMRDVGFLADIHHDYVKQGEQGFVDSNGSYLTREEARSVAIFASQIKPEHGTLYSEDLW